MKNGDEEPLIGDVLIVDDEDKNLMALQAMLDEIPGLRVTKARSGEECLRHCLEQDFFVILLDINMPRLDGFETAHMIRDRKKSYQVPVIFVTAHHSTDAEIERGYALGAVDYILKPIRPAILKTKVHVFLELFRKSEEIKRQEARYREAQRTKYENDLTSVSEQVKTKERELEALTMAISRQQNLTGWDLGSVTAISAGIGPLSQRSPAVYEKLKAAYSQLIDRYLEAIHFRELRTPKSAIGTLAFQIGRNGGGPRDVVELHSDVVKEKCEGVNHNRAMSYVNEGRLLTIELMGYLVDVYRGGSDKHSPTQQSS
jgi:DNA-binding response OmpR family regulator